MEGQKKVLQEELVRPFWMLEYCNGDLPKSGTFKEALPATAYEMDTLRNNGTNLYHFNINILLYNCLNAISNKKVRLAAKSDLTGLLVILCSRSDYVAQIQHGKDVNYFLE